ncbi:ComEC/Rec2 family competence protein [Crocosphaera chwakensis]|uniref:ComEC/Rec2-related protein n=1 Tax=Crocosphaera chwakensis CCY0110 TaxID=391612 RepID=A3IMN6_9CHRO|nr:ComEC/Rec2 family competence protein [Crocosphaera chwakensis]EAZ92139.1 ComEC/Rec2-related protein [Crocosphaera chwakensis CCY0110]
MNSFHYLILILAYVGGLLITGLWGFPNPNPSWQQWCIAGVLIAIIPFTFFILLNRRWRRCPRLRFWFIVSLVAWLAVLYFQWRIPSPRSTDISYLIQDNFRPQKVQLIGKLISEPRLTNNDRKKFWLQAQKVNFDKPDSDFKIVTGKVYVTLPIKEINIIYPGQSLIIEGNLYQPQSPKNPGAFDFKKYLAKQGSFSGLKGEKIIFTENKNNWGLTKLRSRIINGFTNALGEQNGLVISSMILGRRAVDLPPEIRDLFVNMGLSHILAASGFHVALLLGIIFWFTRSLSPTNKLIFGITILILYVGLTGIQPSILRASLMGTAILIGEVVDRKTNPLRTLLLSAFLLLVFNPLWIWDLGFQLSFLATFALLVTSPSIENKLDFLPPKISSMIAVPVAVSIWTSPLIMYVFHTFSFYIIPFNILATPLIILLVIGGMISAIFLLIFPVFGVEIAKFLFWPLEILLHSAKQITQLKLSALVVGQISLSILIIIYGILLIIWLNTTWQKHWKLGGITIILLLIVPIISKNIFLSKITILQGNSVPIVIIQDRGQVTILNTGDETDIKYNLLPFLYQQGINEITNAILTNNETKISLSLLEKEIKIKNIIYLFDEEKHGFDHLDNQTIIKLNSTIIKALNQFPLILKWKNNKQSWLWIDSQVKNDNLTMPIPHQSSDIILWSGQKLSLEWVKLLTQNSPKFIIISTNYIPKFIQKELTKQNIQWYWIQEIGAIQWIPKQGIKPLLKNQEQDS